MAPATTIPHDAFFEERDAFLNANKEILGARMISGISAKNDDDEEWDEDDEDEEEEDEDVDPSTYTKEQMDSIRYVMITKKRQDASEDMEALILGDQMNDPIKTFSTSFSHHVHSIFHEEFLPMYRSKRAWPVKFDLLFGFTDCLSRYDVWMHDNEGGMDDMVSALGKLWKALLEKSDDILAIDGKYTRPGVVRMLEDFKKTVEVCYSEPPFRFRFE